MHWKSHSSRSKSSNESANEKIFDSKWSFKISRTFSTMTWSSITNFFVQTSDKHSYFAKFESFNIKQSKNLWISSKSLVFIETRTKSSWETKRRSLEARQIRSHCRASIRIRPILIFVRRRRTKSIKVRYAFATKFTYSVNAHTLSQSIERQNEKKISRFETKRDRKFSKNSTYFTQ